MKQVQSRGLYAELALVPEVRMWPKQEAAPSEIVAFALEMELALVIALASWVVASELEQQQQQQELGLE